MIEGKEILAIIPARGGSKGLPGKNIRVVAGKSLLEKTIEAAKASQYIDRLILSSDDDKAIKIAKSLFCEVPFIRPSELATDEANPADAILHAINFIKKRYDYIVLLQVTSPLRTTADIDACIKRCIDYKAPSVVSVTKVDKSPYWMYTLDEQRRMKPVLATENRPLRRQDETNIYELNGAVYVAETNFFLKKKSFLCDQTVAYEMPKNRSIDIDTELDIRVLEAMLAALSENPKSKACTHRD